MKNIRTAIIGVGLRGTDNMKTCLNIKGVTVSAVCDLYEDRAENAASIVEEKTGERPFVTTDYREIISRNDIDAIVICTYWRSHTEIALAAMQAGKPMAMEVGGAFSLEECYSLVDAYERTGTPFMFLENCCYGKDELLACEMARDGKFGEIVHCHGAYGHDLRVEVLTGKEKRHYRLEEYKNRNCENYPTHELGPISRVLGINRGNRMLRLVSVASKAAGLSAYVSKHCDTIENKELIGQSFAQGDIVNTIITCEDGATISLKLDTTLPRTYNREFTVRGTQGMYEQSTNCVFIDGDAETFEPSDFYRENIGNAKRYEEQYLPDIWKNRTEEQKEAGHGGMDYFAFDAFFKCIRTGEPMPIDVYDAAAWMCISYLSELSIAGGNIPVEIPDFTNGAYKTRPYISVIK